MTELVTRAQADLLINALTVLGVVAAPVAFVLARRAKADAVAWAAVVGGPLVLMGVLWRVYNAIEDRFGLDSVAALLLNLALFVAVGALCGVGVSYYLARVRASDTEAQEASRNP